MIKKEIPIPTGVHVTFADGSLVVKGPKGELTMTVRPEAKVTVNEAESALRISEEIVSRSSGTHVGTAFALVRNMMKGVSEGYTKILELEGVGFRVGVEGKELVFALGFSHPIRFAVPNEVDAKVEKNTITISGIDKELVGLVSAKIRDLKKPEPYKGKGIHYRGEVLRRKAGKKAVASGGK